MLAFFQWEEPRTRIITRTVEITKIVNNVGPVRINGDTYDNQDVVLRLRGSRLMNRRLKS